jgi:hypothetical protein
LKKTARKKIGSSKIAMQIKKLDRLRSLNSCASETIDITATLNKRTPLARFLVHGHRMDLTHRIATTPGYNAKAVKVCISLNGTQVSVADFDAMTKLIADNEVMDSLKSIGFQRVRDFKNKRDEIKTAEGMSRALALTSKEQGEEVQKALGIVMNEKFSRLMESMSSMTNDMTEFSDQMYTQGRERAVLQDILSYLESGDVDSECSSKIISMIRNVI